MASHGLVTAVNAANALTTLAINLLLASNKYATLVNKAVAENRDVTELELDALFVDSQTAVSDAVAELDKL